MSPRTISLAFVAESRLTLNLISTSPEHSILVDTVLAYMNDTDDQYHEDVIRAFFRYRTQEIGKLLGRIYDQVTTASQNLDHDTAGSLSEANSIVLVSPFTFSHPSPSTDDS